MTNGFALGTIITLLMALQLHAAPRKYEVNMRVGLNGQPPLSVNTLANVGKKSTVSEISSDGRTETVIEMVARERTVNNDAGLLMDVTVTKKVLGEKRASQTVQIFAKENQEAEIVLGQRKRGRSDLQLAVIAKKPASSKPN